MKIQGKINPHKLLARIWTSNISKTAIEIRMVIPQKLNIGIPFDWTGTLLGTFPKELRPILSSDTCIFMFKAG